MIEQGTDEWFAVRCGKVTASRIADMLARTKTGWGASRMNYCAQLVAERLTGAVAESYVSPPMLRGMETEAEARSVYEMTIGQNVKQIGFVVHPNIDMSGASPDGLVGDAGLVEIKCPNTATHIATLLGGSVPGKYRLQMQWQMACTGRQWCDFVSYDPRMPEQMRLFVDRIERCDETIADVEKEAIVFLGEVQEIVDQLTRRYGSRIAAE
ncbi:MAG: YqaJ viral recombinase family protein [Caldilineaceae bacterium]|nr:YqaJ viral recombinase family protein [Caldilineaceae bacterium]